MHTNSARPWFAMGDFYLRNEIKIGRCTEKIAETLDREIEDVRRRASELGLKLPDASDAGS